MKTKRQKDEQAAIERGEHLYYIVLRHTNIRVFQAGGDPEIYTDYDAARDHAAFWSKSSNLHNWYVPMRISEYNETFGRFNTTGPLTVNVDGWATINASGVVKED